MSLFLASVELYRLYLISYSKTKLITHSKLYINLTSPLVFFLLPPRPTTFSSRLFSSLVVMQGSSLLLKLGWKIASRIVAANSISQICLPSPASLGQIDPIWYLKFKLWWLIRIGHISCRILGDWKTRVKEKAQKRCRTLNLSEKLICEEHSGTAELFRHFLSWGDVRLAWGRAVGKMRL